MTTQAGLASVMMPAYNAEKYIEAAIESVLAQTYPHWELVVVDDGSTDDTAAIIARFADPRIRPIHQENGGEAVARNTALQHVRGEFLAFLDADDLYLPQHLERTVGYLQAHPERDAVYTDGVHVDQDGNRLGPLSANRRGPFEGCLFEELVLASDVFGPPVCVVTRSEGVIQRDLRFDPAIVIGPDWDFWTRYAERATFGYVDEQTCLYRVHESNITVQVDLERRAGYLARCREKAIKLERFAGCAPETRVAVFYDLLIELLRTRPGRQETVSHWPEFNALPAGEQARLLRLMASKTLLDGRNHDHVPHWLHRARQLNPADRYAATLSALYRASPWLCHLLLRAKDLTEPRPENRSPFHNLD